MSKECKICHNKFETQSPYVLLCSDDCRAISQKISLKKFKSTPKGKALKKKERESVAGKNRRARYELKEQSKLLSRARVKSYYSKKKSDGNFLHKRLEQHKKYYHAVLKNDVGFRIKSRMSVAIHRCLKENKKSEWLDIVGYSAMQLREKLDTTMPKGYTWDNFLKGELHIDHIYPISRFNIKTPNDDDFKKCWSLDNLRLLLAMENIMKSNKILV